MAAFEDMPASSDMYASAPPSGRWHFDFSQTCQQDIPRHVCNMSCWRTFASSRRHVFPRHLQLRKIVQYRSIGIVLTILNIDASRQGLIPRCFWRDLVEYTRVQKLITSDLICCTGCPKPFLGRSTYMVSEPYRFLIFASIFCHRTAMTVAAEAAF